MKFELLGVGQNLGNVLTSDALDIQLGLTKGTIQSLSGVAQRYVAPKGMLQSAFAAAALKDCAAHANISLDSLDLLLATSAVPQQAIPSTASFIAHELGLDGKSVFDINASCLGFVVSLYQAINLLQTKAYQRIGIVASDIASAGLNWQNLHASAIFGDGAAAVIVQAPNPANSPAGIRLNCLGYEFKVYPQGRHFCEIRAGGTRANATVGMTDGDFLFDMDGKAVFKIAMQYTEEFVSHLLAKAHLTYDDIDCVVMHQASHLGMKHAISRLHFRPETIINIYPMHGNQVSASIPTVLYHAFIQGKLTQGARLALLGTAAGFGIGGMILQVE